MLNRLLAVLSAALLSAILVAGCATQQQAEYTATGAGIGAVTGAIIGGVLGGMSGHAGEGVVLGSIFGGLAGASIGNAEYHQQRSEEEAARMYSYNYQQQTRDLVRIEEVSASPPRVLPGDKVDLNVTYTLLSPARHTELVRETREVRHDGRIVGRPYVTVSRGGGTWLSTVPITIPDGAEPGVYVVTTIVETESAGDTRDFTFRVDSESRWRR